MSHHATEDIAIMRALPNLVVMAPGDYLEAEACTRALCEYKGTAYMRLGRGGEKRIHESLDGFCIGKAIKVRDGSRVAIFSTGAIYDEVETACEILNGHSIHPSTYTFPTVKPVDCKTIEECCRKYDLIVTCEEHNIVGGFGSAVAEVMAELSGEKASLMRVGINDSYSETVGNQAYLRDVYGISAQKIASRIIERLNG